MPGPKSHDIFYKKLYDQLDDKTKCAFPNYDKFNIYAQGHDFLIYHDFYKIWSQKKLNTNIENSVQLQENSFPEFVYNYLKSAKDNGVLEDEQVRLFIGPGYVMHHLLDAYTHPQIIYFSGDHVRDPKNDTWMHGIYENLFDIYMMDKYENKDSLSYKVHKDFSIDGKIISSNLVTTLDDSLGKTYNITYGGETFRVAFSQLELFMKTMKYDPRGRKKELFDKFDPLLKGTSSFSYHRTYDEVPQMMNMQHEKWCNPMDESITSIDSFIDLFDKALIDGSDIVNKLEKLCQSGVFNLDDIYSIVPNVSSTSGLECNKKLEIKYTRTKNRF